MGSKMRRDAIRFAAPEKDVVLEMNFASAMRVWRTFTVADTWGKPHGPALSADLFWAVRRQDSDKCGGAAPLVSQPYYGIGISARSPQIT